MLYRKYELICAYIRVKKGFIRPNEARAYLQALETAFGGTISQEGVQSKELKNLFYRFDSSVQVAIKTISTWEGVLEDSDTPKLIKKLGATGKQLQEMDEQVNALLNQAKNLNERLIERYFDVLWPQMMDSISSEQLREAGFDDSVFADSLFDYWDPYF